MRRFLATLMALTLLLVLWGCGGGSGSSGSGGQNSGGNNGNGNGNGNGNNGGGNSGNGGTGATGGQPTPVAFTVNWPQRSRSVTALTSALSLVMTLKDASPAGGDFTWKMDRDVVAAGGQKAYVSSDTCTPGRWDLTLKLYAQPNAAGALVGTASARVNIAADGTGIPALTVVGTIASVSVPAGQSLLLGAKKDLVFTTKDAAGSLVAVTPGSALWTVLEGPPILRFVNGQVEGLAGGTARVVATVDGKVSPAANVTVNLPIPPLTISAKDKFGSPVPDVDLIIESQGSVVRQLKTATGTEIVNNLPIGLLTIRGSKDGFKPASTTVTLASQAVTATLTLLAQGRPSATTLTTRPVTRANDAFVFDADIAVRDADGKSITNLTAAAFSIAPKTQTGVTWQYATGTATRINQTPKGVFSTLIALDQSGSVASSDPAGLRLQATKGFFSLLQGGEEAALSYFPAVSNSPNLKTFPEIGFVSNGTAYNAEIDKLFALRFNGTPLFSAVVQGVNYLKQKARNANRAMILISDGASVGDGNSLISAVNVAKQNNIRLYTIIIGQNYSLETMAKLAQETGGSSMYAQTAQQLISHYTSLDALLQGTGDFYRVRFTVSRTSGTFAQGQTLSGSIKIVLPGDTPLETPFFVTIP